MRAGASAAADLLDAAMTLPPRLRARLLAALALFPLDSRIWQDLSTNVVNLTTDVEEPDPMAKPDPASKSDVVMQAAMLPLNSAVRPAQWTEIAEYLPVSEWIEVLRNRLDSDPHAADAAEMLACLPIEDHQVAPETFARTVADDSSDAALWAAIAAGRLGDFDPIDSVLDRLAADGGPILPARGRWSTYRALARARPIPTSLFAHLRPRGTPMADVVVWALKGIADPDGDPLETAESLNPDWADDANQPTDPEDAAEPLLGPDALQAPSLAEGLTPSRQRALSQLDLDTAGRVVANLLDLLALRAADGTDWHDEYPDPVLKVVAALPKGYSLAVFDLLRRYLSPQTDVDTHTLSRRLAFAIACADIDDVLSGFAQSIAWVVNDGGPESALLIEILSLFEQVAYWSADTPAFWAGPTAPVINVGHARAYRDISMTIKRNDHFGGFGGIDTGDFSSPPMTYAGPTFGDRAGPSSSVDMGYSPARPTSIGPSDPETIRFDRLEVHPRVSIGPRLFPRLRWPWPRPRFGSVFGRAAPPPGDPSEPRNAPTTSPQPRSVRADVYLAGDPAPRDAFVRGQPHQVAVWIGHDRDAQPNTVTANFIFVDAEVAPDPGPFTELQVTLWNGDHAQSATLSLPNDRELSSKPCAFELTVASDQAKVSAMIIVGQQDRALQQFRLTGKTVGSAKDRAGADKITLITEVEARPLEGAATGTAIDASVHSSAAGGPSLVIQGGKARIAAPWDENIRPTVNDIAAKIYKADRAAASGDGEPAWVELIRLLAMKGAQLHSWLKDAPGYEQLPSAQRIQLFDADATRPLPIELVYDGPRIAKTAVPCLNWDQALALGHCGQCATTTSDDDATNPPPFWSPTICPLGFWGLTKVIERQTGTSATKPSRLDLLGSVMFAASDKVRQTDYDATVDVLTTVRQQCPAIATTWNQWPELVTEHRPTLIVALPHQDRDTEWNMDYLEIGKDSQLYSGQVMDMLKIDAHAPGPVLLLLGCRTGNTKATFQNFVAEFRTAGAPIVLGTIATVLGRDAAAIAQEFVRELSATSGSGGGNQILFGEAMRTVRRLMIAKKKAAALGLIAFGDSDWQVEVGI